MVGVFNKPTTEEDLNQPSKLKSPENPLPLDISASEELDDFSLSFADSFLDFDAIKDWIEENPVLDMTDMKPDPDGVEEGNKEIGVADCFVEMAAEGSKTLGNLGSSIVEGMGKVSLQTVSKDSVVGIAGEITNANLNRAKSDEVAGLLENESERVEGKTVIDDDAAKNSEISRIKRNYEKNGKKVSEEEDGESSSNSESSSSSSPSSSSEEDEEEEEEMVRESDLEEGEIRDSDVDEMVGWSDDEENGDHTKRPVTSQNKLKVLPRVPPVNVNLELHHQTLPVGVVQSIIGNQVIVEGVEKHNPLNEGSILWMTDSRSPLGLVDEIFGPVKNPFYVIRYNSENDIPTGVEQGTLISFVAEFANHVLNDSSLYMKGYDTSGENDQENSDEVEFSDDEKEAEYKKMLKMTKRGPNDQKVEYKKDKKKFKNRRGTWKNNRPSSLQEPGGARQLPTDQCQYSVPAGVSSLDLGNCQMSLGPQERVVGMPGFIHPFLQVAQAPCLIPPSNEVWTNRIPSQPCLSFPNGFPSTGMPWPVPNLPPQSFHFPFPSGMPLQQQLSYQVPSPSGMTLQQQQQQLVSGLVLPSNAIVGRQLNLYAGPPLAPWPGSMAQNVINQPLGMGSQCQQNSPSTKLELSPVTQGNIETSQKFNQRACFSNGRKNYRRGGGRFGGGRGRQELK